MNKAKETMKKLIPLLTFTLILHLSASAAVPLKWTVETSRATPAQFEAYQGETLALEAALQSYGKPLAAPSGYSLYWQTNGMGSTYWSVPCIQTFEHSEHSNILYATWSPTNDVGARVYNCFIGQPGTIYHAAFQLRLRPSPGALPNELPLPQKVIDFAKVTVLNPPWSGGGGGGVDTNAVIDIVHKTVDGSARTLPKYLWLYEADDSYPDAAAEYYHSRGNGKVDGGCSSVCSGGFLYRNFDYPFDERTEFVVKMSAGKDRFASVGVAQVGTNLTEQIVTSGKPEYSRLYKWLPGATVDGINENGVVCEINVVDGEPPASAGGGIHPLAAVRWALDKGTSAEMVATSLAERISFPSSWVQNFHWMVADETETWIVENGTASNVTAVAAKRVMTNFAILPDTYSGMGKERYDLLREGESITNAWFTNAFKSDTEPEWISEFGGSTDMWYYSTTEWAKKPKEDHRGEKYGYFTWWQTVHTSIYDITNRTLRVAVQEQDDWYVFQVPASGVKVDAYTKAETDAKLSPIEAQIAALQEVKRDKTDRAIYDAVPDSDFGYDSQHISDNDELLEESDGIYPTWSDYLAPARWTPLVYVLDHWTFDLENWIETGDFGAHSLVVRFRYYRNDDPSVKAFVTWTRPGVVLTVGNFATESGVEAAIAAHHDGTKQDIVIVGGILKGYGNGDIIAATAGVDYATPEQLNGKRDTQDNTCHKTEFTKWTFSDGIEREIYIDEDFGFYVDDWTFVLYDSVTHDHMTDESTDVYATADESISPVEYTATRSTVCKTNELFTTKGYVDGKVSAAVSTNNPAFVSAVRAIAPTTIRTYDSVRQCWWVLEMVNGVPTWTVED